MGGLPNRVGQVGLQQLKIAAICLEGDIEKIAQDRNRTRQRFYAHVHQHARNRHARNTELDCAHDDV